MAEEAQGEGALGKVAIIGLDGLPFDMLDQLAHSGILPNFRRVFEEGASGVLRSTIPPLSPLAWTSIMTGLNPGKHGIFGFLDRHLRPHSSRDLMGKAIWDIASSARRRVICLNVPFTYPPYPVRGLMVAGPPCPSDEVSTYPRQLSRELSELGYKVDIEGLGEDYTGMREADFMAEAEEITKLRAEALLSILDGEKWDFLCAVFTTPDRVQHVFFGRAHRESPFYEPRGREMLIRYFKLLDSLIGKLLRELLSEAVVILSSDHGFEPLHTYIGLQNVLEGFLMGRRGARRLLGTSMKLLGALGLANPIKKALRKLGLAGAAREKLSGGLICGMGFIYIAEPSLKSLSEEMIAYLSSLRDSSTGSKVIKRVFRREELYHGPFLGEAPDILLLPEAGYELRAMRNRWLERVRPEKGMTYKTGTHMSEPALRGFFAIVGEDVEEGSKLDAGVCDIAPTALHILGLPVPEDVDGRVLIEAFEEKGELARRKVKRACFGLRRKMAQRARRLRARHTKGGDSLSL